MRSHRTGNAGIAAALTAVTMHMATAWAAEAQPAAQATSPLATSPPFITTVDPPPPAAPPPPLIRPSYQPVISPRPPGAAPPMSQQAQDSMRKSYTTQIENSLRDAAPLLKLDGVQMQRLVALLADRLVADMQTGIRRQAFSGDLLTSGAYAEPIANEFGADVAERWTVFENLRSGLPFVDQQLKFYYNAGEPLNEKQRLRLATDYQRVTLAAIRDSAAAAAAATAAAAAPGTAVPAGNGPAGMARAVQRMESELASAEATTAAVLTAARAYLNRTQLDVLSTQLEASVATRRQTVRMMRENAGLKN